MTITSPTRFSARLRFPPRVELGSTSSDRSMIASVECTSKRLFDARVGRDVASIPSLVKSIPTVWGSGVLPAPTDGAFARPFPLAEGRFELVDEFALFVDEGDGSRETPEGGGGGGGGGGLAYSSVHCRAFWSCIERLRRYSVAIDGTG